MKIILDTQEIEKSNDIASLANNLKNFLDNLLLKLNLIDETNADTVDGFHASSTATANYLLALDSNAKLPASITGDADTVDGLHAHSLFLANNISFNPKPPGVNEYVVPYAVNSTTATTLTLTSSRVYWIPFVVPKPLTITEVAINVTNASAGTHYIGIYASDSKWQPTGNTLVTCSFNTESTGVKTFSASLSLTNGVYWICWASASAPTVRAIALGACPSFELSSLGTANTTCWYTSGSSLPNPAPTSGFTSLTGSALPAVGFKFSFN